jgi:hypothetical protein
MNLLKKLIVLGSIPLVAACPSPPSAPPSAAPALSWGVFDATTGQKISIERGNTATVTGTDLLQIFLYVNDAQGVGNSVLSGAADQVQCGYKQVHPGKLGVVTQLVDVGAPINRNLPVQSHAYPSTYSFQVDAYYFNYAEQNATFIRLCPTRYSTNEGTTTGGELTGTIRISGSATDRSVPPNQTTSTLLLVIDSGQ